MLCGWADCRRELQAGANARPGPDNTEPLQGSRSFLGLKKQIIVSKICQRREAPKNPVAVFAHPTWLRGRGCLRMPPAGGNKTAYLTYLSEFGFGLIRERVSVINPALKPRRSCERPSGGLPSPGPLRFADARYKRHGDNWFRQIVDHGNRSRRSMQSEKRKIWKILTMCSVGAGSLPPPYVKLLS